MTSNKTSQTHQTTCTEILDEIQTAVIADRDFLETVFTGVLAGGHVLLEDVPGTGKTLTARLFAQALGLSFNRIQFTPDLLPSDITGSHIYNEQNEEFEFQHGPIFSNIILADEINRAPPKTQAALLEAMEEGQVSVDGTTWDLPDPFFVIATQNPVEQEGTFELPEAQRDRFIIKTQMGYPNKSGELELLDRRASRQSQSAAVTAITDADMITALQLAPESIDVHDDIRTYIVEIARATRTDSRVRVGVSPRGIQRFFEALRARAVIHGRDYVVPDDVKVLAYPVLQHRVILTPEAAIQNTSTATILDEILDSIDVPAVADVAKTA